MRRIKTTPFILPNIELMLEFGEIQKKHIKKRPFLFLFAKCFSNF